MKPQEHKTIKARFRTPILQLTAKWTCTCTFLICALFCQALASGKSTNLQKDSALQIYLPREVTIKDSRPIELGKVGIIYGQEPLQSRASEITLGQVSVPGQEIVIDRVTILSRLACSDIPASKVKLSGAEKITIKRQHKIITGGEFVELAKSFLKKNPPAGSPCQLNPARMPKDLILPGAGKNIKLSPRLVRTGTKNQARVQIGVFDDGKKVAVRDVTFHLKYNCRRAVTSAEIDAGQLISPDNVRIEKTLSNEPEPADWTPPYGLVTKRRLPANTVLHPNTVAPARAAVVIKRNQNVVIRIDRPGLLVTAIGKAMQDAGAGEYIKVRNIDSQRIIFAKVNEDGTVEPVF